MSSLADLSELVGFFSYSRDDDADSQGALSALRNRIQGELRGQLGRTPKTFRLWQDKEAIASGTLWESEIKNSIEQAVFFIPIITPTVAASPYCRFELDAFLAREAELGRNDLVFPILYIHVPALEDSVRREKDAVLSLIARRQYVDWREFRHLDANSTEVKRAVERFCSHIRDALNKPWLSPEERAAQEKAAALQREEDDRKRQAAEERRQEEEARKMAAVARERERADAERRQREEEAEQRRAEERRLRDEAKARRLAAEEQRRAEKEERRRLRSAEAPPLWPPSRPALVAASVVCLVLVGAIGVWLAELLMPASPARPTPAPVETAPAPAPVASAPAPVAPTPQASVKPAPAPIAPSPTPVAPTPQVPVVPAPAPAAPRLLVANTPLAETQERALKPGDRFQECTNCPVMIVVPAGSFNMGSPVGEPGHKANEEPQHPVTIAQQFALGQFDVTFDEWDACVADGHCDRPTYPGPGLDNGWGRGRRPVINVSWLDAKGYVRWLSEKTGKTYRLLTEAEWEYAARAGTTTAYSWGDTVGAGNANCKGCGSQWDDKETAPVGSFAANRFGLFDVHGNARQWVEDCYHENYVGAPSNGSAWTLGDRCFYVLRGGAYEGDAGRAASRRGIAPGNRFSEWSFRVARTLGPVAPTPPAPVMPAPAPSPPSLAPVAPAPVVPAPAPAVPAQLVANAPLTPAQERALKRGDTFRECTNCPVMIVVPAGTFNMGGPASEPGHFSNEEPQHRVTIAQQFAAGQFEVTFDEWDACVADGGCEKPNYPGPGRDDGWGRGRRPVLYVSWRDAEGYVKWLSSKTGRPYRLLTEAEWEYAARAGTTTAYSWGDTVGVGNANCNGCGSQWDNKQTAPVDSFAANPFGLFDVFGNARQWVEDCYHANYVGAPSNGSAWMSGECTSHVLRGGAYNRDAKYCRAASRGGVAPGGRYSDQSFRIARKLGP